MTDKQTIIDGVDVSGCVASHFNFDGCFYECKIKGFHNNCFYIDCEDNPNCNYKQLKRKEQEYKELKQTLTEIKEIAEEILRIADSVGVNGVYRLGLAKHILQKISEVTENENS